MKKLTKRVQAGGLWFDVPVFTSNVVANGDGSVWAINIIAACKLIRESDDWRFPIAEGGEYACVGSVSLEGADWRECCWFVGDQVDGEAVERREWMARSFSEGYDLGHSRGLNCGRLYKSDDGMRGHRHACLRDHLGYNSGEVE